MMTRSNYYRQIYVLFELIRAMRGRETIFMDKEEHRNCIRGMKVVTINFLKKSFFDMCHFESKNYNIYISCAKFKDIPPFTFNLGIRSAETRQWFENEALDLITDYDLLLDFDCPDNRIRKDYLMEVKTVHDLLNQNAICFYIIHSGSGYQIVIPSSVYGFEKEKEIVDSKTFRKPYILIREIKETFSLKYLDISGIGVYNKIMKCPYSLVDNTVCLPLNNFSGQDFNFSSQYVLRVYPIKERGLCLHNNYGEQRNKDLFFKFCKKFGIEKFKKGGE